MLWNPRFAQEDFYPVCVCPSLQCTCIGIIPPYSSSLVFTHRVQIAFHMFMVIHASHSRLSTSSLVQPVFCKIRPLLPLEPDTTFLRGAYWSLSSRVGDWWARSPRNQFLGRRWWCSRAQMVQGADITKDAEFSVGGWAVDSGGLPKVKIGTNQC